MNTWRKEKLHDINRPALFKLECFGIRIYGDKIIEENEIICVLNKDEPVATLPMKNNKIKDVDK